VLLVAVVVDKSAIHGLGAFAVETIPRGNTDWRFTPGFDLDLDPALLDAQPAHFRRVLLHYGYIDRRLHRFILCCDDARFINHSDTPNLCSEVAAERYGVDVAVRGVNRFFTHCYRPPTREDIALRARRALLVSACTRTCEEYASDEPVGASESPIHRQATNPPRWNLMTSTAGSPRF
jgi:hypothetical protein